MNATTAVFLVSLWINPGWGAHRYEYKMPSWEKCIESVEKSKSKYSRGNESEGGGQLFCIERKD